MELADKIDICETLYGKMTKAFGIIYWDMDKKHLVNVDTGEDLLSHVEYNEYAKPRYVNSEYLKVGRQALFVKDNTGHIMVYNKECKPVLNIELNIRTSTIREYISNSSRLAIYLLGRKTVASGMRVLILNIDTGAVEEFIDNVVRFFESEELLKVVTIDSGKLSTRQFSL